MNEIQAQLPLFLEGDFWLMVGARYWFLPFLGAAIVLRLLAGASGIKGRAAAISYLPVALACVPLYMLHQPPSDSWLEERRPLVAAAAASLGWHSSATENMTRRKVLNLYFRLKEANEVSGSTAINVGALGAPRTETGKALSLRYM